MCSYFSFLIFFKLFSIFAPPVADKESIAERRAEEIDRVKCREQRRRQRAQEAEDDEDEEQEDDDEADTGDFANDTQVRAGLSSTHENLLTYTTITVHLTLNARQACTHAAFTSSRKGASHCSVHCK